MEAGCTLNLDPDFGVDMSETSKECVTIVASNLAKRRRQLLRLGQEKLGIHLDWDPTHIPDEIASALCTTLTRAGIIVPQHLSVPAGYTTIFHLPSLPLPQFETFWNKGFRGVGCRNALGLTPIMIWRHDMFRRGVGVHGEEAMSSAWRWAQDEGLLDQRVKDPLSLNLNTFSTGWHYMAATLGSSDLTILFLRGKSFTESMLDDLFQTTIRDQCACWCNPRGHGCSVLKSFWNARADWKDNGYYDFQTRNNKVGRHCLLHHHHEIEHSSHLSNANLIGTKCLELVRLLTFEALDMTHTCCYLEQVANLQAEQPLIPAQRKALSLEGSRRFELSHIIANCNAQLAEEIWADSLEQQNAHQLNELMDEFEPQILEMDFLDPNALQRFIWGPWRRRISALFAVDHKVVAEIEQVVNNVTVTRKPFWIVTIKADDYGCVLTDN